MIQTLQNIPPIWTGLALWLADTLYIELLPRRICGFKRYLTAFVFLPLQCLYMQLTGDLNGTLFNLSMTGAALLTLLPFWALCRISFCNTLYYCTRAFILGRFMDSLAWQLYSFSRQMQPVLDQNRIEALFVAVIYAVILFAMFMLERGHPAELQIPALTCSVTVLIAVVIYILSSLSYSRLRTPFGGTSDPEAFNIRSLTYLGGVAILYAVHVQLCDSFVRQEKEALQNILNLQYANYRISQESIELVNQKYHDFKHQIAILRARIGSEQKLEYLDRLEGEIHAYEAQNKTGNQVLDTILTSKSIYCQNNGIQLTCVADGSALDFMDIMDLCTLFGNALDNAIESVSRLPDPDQRLIHLSVTREKGFLRIRLENRCPENLNLNGQLPKTTKKDANNHGYGLKSIQQTAQKYGGSVTIQSQNGWFELRILISSKL